MKYFHFNRPVDEAEITPPSHTITGINRVEYNPHYGSNKSTKAAFISVLCVCCLDVWGLQKLSLLSFLGWGGAAGFLSGLFDSASISSALHHLLQTLQRPAQLRAICSQLHLKRSEKFYFGLERWVERGLLYKTVVILFVILESSCREDYKRPHSESSSRRIDHPTHRKVRFFLT